MGAVDGNGRARVELSVGSSVELLVGLLAELLVGLSAESSVGHFKGVGS